MAYKIKQPKAKEKKTNYKTLYAVDYDENNEDEGTFEIFNTKKEAETFSKKVKGKLWVAEFNKDFIFVEEGNLNYEDNAYLYKNRRKV